MEELLLLSTNYYLAVGIKWSYVISVTLGALGHFLHLSWMDSCAEKDMDVLTKVIKVIVHNVLHLHLF